jgi:hypothetical protein
LRQKLSADKWFCRYQCYKKTRRHLLRNISTLQNPKLPLRLHSSFKTLILKKLRLVMAIANVLGLVDYLLGYQVFLSFLEIFMLLLVTERACIEFN